MEKQETIKLRLTGRTDIMFDRFYGQEADTRPPEQKFYLASGNRIVLPTENIYSFLFGEYPAGCAKSIEGKKGKDYIRTGQAFVTITPQDFVPFKRNGKDIIFTDFKGNDDSYYITEFSPRVRKGTLSIKQNVKKRPAIRCPWTLEFELQVFKNNLISTEKLFNWFTSGGIVIGLGTYRPRYGSFEVGIIE